MCGASRRQLSRANASACKYVALTTGEDPSGCRPGLLAVVHRYLPAGKALVRDELELPRAFQPGEERRPVAGEDGMDDQLVLVNEAEFLQLGGERGAAEQHLARGPRLERDDGLAQVAQEVDGV